MGPPDRVPQFPLYDVWLENEADQVPYFGPRIGGSVDCNWLQARENLMDPFHVTWLHMEHSGPQFPSDIFAARPRQVDYTETEHGMKFTMYMPLPDHKREFQLSWEM